MAIAVLNARSQQALKIAPGGTQTLWLSDDTAIKQILHRAGQDLPLGGYVRMQDILERAVYVSTTGELKLVYYQDGQDIACAVIKATADRKELYSVSLRRSNQKELDKAIASGKGTSWL